MALRLHGRQPADAARGAALERVLGLLGPRVGGGLGVVARAMELEEHHGVALGRDGAHGGVLVQRLPVLREADLEAQHRVHEEVLEEQSLVRVRAHQEPVDALRCSRRWRPPNSGEPSTCS